VTGTVKIQVGRRDGVAGVLIAVMLFALIFTAGFGYFIFQDESNLLLYKANSGHLSSQNAAYQENVAFNATSNAGQLTVVVNNTGGLPLSVVSAYVTNSAGALSPPGVMQLGGAGSCVSTATNGPLNLDVGQSGSLTISNSCYSYPSGSIISISLLTSRGNIFSAQFPTTTTTVVTTTTVSSQMTTTAPGVGGGNSLVVVMAATPVQTYSGPCPGISCITDNVTVFNYSNQPITGITLNPATPSFSVTGTASLVPVPTPGCTRPTPSDTIPGYSGTGLAPSVEYLCTYSPNSGSVGGLASFSGGAYGTQGSTTVYSATVTSNLVQVGSLVNPLAQGAFSANFFFFKYSACINTSTPCTTDVPGGMPPSSVYNIPEGAVIPSPTAPFSINNLQYVAFYVQLTNNFNTTLPLLGTTFEQFDPSGAGGSETNYWIVGSNTTMQNGVYYPNYSSTPTLTAYPSDCANVNPATNKPTDHACIYINPGQSVVITLAACGPSVNSWDWGTVTTSGFRGTSYSVNNAGSPTCVSASPFPNGSLGASATVGTTVVQFEYDGIVFAQDLQFQGVAFT
jgi:hypothetical protein